MSLKNKKLRRSHFVERYKSGTAKEFDQYVRQIDKRVRAILSKQDSIKTAKQLGKIQRELREEIFAIYKDWNNHFRTALVDFSKSEVNFLVKALDFEVNTPSAAVLRAAITSRPFQKVLLRESLLDLARTDIKLLKNAIAAGFYSGQSNSEIIRTIRGTKANGFKDGLLHLSKNRTSRLVRTAINHTGTVANMVFFEENADIIKRYQWLSTLDSRTSDICTELADKIFTVGKGPVPPAHWNCRSAIVAVV